MGILSFLIKKKKQKRPTCAAVIAAAGNSTRMGQDKLLMLLDGIPVIVHTMLAFEQCSLVDKIVVVTKSELIASINTLCRDYGVTKVTDIVRGGDNRSQSVLNGVLAVGDIEYVMIHDGARPLVTQEVIHDAFNVAVEFGAAAPGVRVKDTIKIVKGDLVTSTPDRDSLVAVQTPQVFYTGLIKGALSRALENNESFSDDCAAVEAIGMSVHITKGDYRNIKITTQEDYITACALISGEVLV
jgi:2-C-methyl-D-erythritol 4-phosphate cytidylyltransferase